MSSRSFAPEGRRDRTTENRGVPGSSPGLATAKTPMASGFSGFRSGLFKTPIGYSIGYRYPTYFELETRSPVFIGVLGQLETN
jgi:hypothetical protein